MCQGWTNSETCIKKQTGLGIGVVKIKGKNRYHEYDVCDKDKVNDGGADYIYDSNTCNFHFLPVLASDEVVDTLKYYLAAAEDVTNKIYDILNEKHHRVNVSKGTGRFFMQKDSHKRIGIRVWQMHFLNTSASRTAIGASIRSIS